MITAGATISKPDKIDLIFGICKRAVLRLPCLLYRKKTARMKCEEWHD